MSEPAKKVETQQKSNVAPRHRGLRVEAGLRVDEAALAEEAVSDRSEESWIDLRVLVEKWSDAGK